MKTFLPICLVLLVMISMPGFSQDKPDSPPDPPVKGNFSAQFMISTGLRSVNLHLIGGTLKYTFHNSSYAVALMPTLSFREDQPEPGKTKKPFVRPGFSIGPLYQFKKLMIGLPIFYQDDKWRFNVGVGIKVGN